MENRLITVCEGTGMGDELFVMETNAPVEKLKELERISCKVYLDGGDFEDVPNWENVLKDKGYSFEYVNSHGHVTPYGSSKMWLEENYPTITEHYVIENQPEL